MSEYGALVTTKYKSLEAAAQAGGTQVVFTSFAVGDANGNVPPLSNAGTGLVHQVYAASVGSVVVNAANPFQIDISCPLPSTDANGVTIGPFSVTEVAVYDQSGNQVVAGVTSFEKTTAAEGQDSSYNFIVSIVVSDTNAVVVTTPSGAFATQADITDIDAAMADLLATVAWSINRRLHDERRVRAHDERLFQLNRRLTAVGL